MKKLICINSTPNYLRVKHSIFFLLVLLIFSGCKKQELASDDLEKPKIPKSISDRILSHGLRTIIPVNISGKMESLDAFGNQRKKKVEGMENFSIPGACDDLDQYLGTGEYTLASLTKEYDCDQGYKFTAKWQISSAYVLSETFGSSFSIGRFRIKNSSNTIIYPTSGTVSNIPCSITYIGPDTRPGFSGYDLYDVEYSTPYISHTIMGTAYWVENGFKFFTNCGDGSSESIPVSYVRIGGYLIAATAAAVPCSRIDFVDIYYDPYVNPPANIAIVGVDPMLLCSSSGGYVRPTGSEIQIWDNSTSTWRHLKVLGDNLYTPPLYWPPVTPYTSSTIYPYLSVLDITGVDLPTGIHKFRYRNFESSVTPPTAPTVGTITCYGAWSPEVSVTVP